MTWCRQATSHYLSQCWPRSLSPYGVIRPQWVNLYGHHRGCLNNPIFSNLRLCVACWAHIMCHHKLWPISMSHPFSSLNTSFGLTGGKYYQKITIPIFRLILQNFAFPDGFLIFFFYSYLFSLISSLTPLVVWLTPKTSLCGWMSYCDKHIVIKGLSVKLN